MHRRRKQEKQNFQRKPANRTTTTRTDGKGTRARTEGQAAMRQNITERNGTDRADQPGLAPGRVPKQKKRRHAEESSRKKQLEETRQDQGQDQDQDGRTNGTGTYRRNGTERFQRPGPEHTDGTERNALTGQDQNRKPGSQNRTGAPSHFWRGACPKPLLARCVPRAISGEVRAPSHFWRGASEFKKTE